MATIVWVNPQGKTVRSHTLDPAGTKREIEEQHGGRIVTVEQPREAKPKITYHRDPSTGRVTHITKESTVIGEEPKEEPKPEPVVEPEEEKKPVSPAVVGVLPSIYESPAYKRHVEERIAPYKGVVTPIAPPIAEPGMYDRPGITATPEQIRELPPPTPPSPEQVRQVSIARAERDIEVRLEEERTGFEREYQPKVQDIVQARYDELMGEKARSLGMVLDPATGTWMYTDTGQLEKFYNYQPIAQQLALEQGTSFYEREWEQFGMGERAERIYREEYGEEGFVLVEKPEGGYGVVPKKEYERQQRMLGEREAIKARMAGTPEERIMEFTRFVSLSVMKPGMLFEVGRQAIFETPEEALETYAGKTAELKGKDIPGVFVSSYTDPTGLGFYSLLYGGFKAMSVGLGAIPGAGGQILQKGVPVAIMGGVSTAVGVDIGVTAAMESPFRPEEGFKPEELFLKGESGKKAVMYGTALAYMMGLGYAATRPYTLLEPKYKPVHGVLETPVGKKFEVVGVKKYGELFGREVFGKYRFLAGREYQYPLGGYRSPLAISEGKLPYRTGKPVTTELSKAVISLTQIKGVQEITYDVASGMFAVEKTATKMKPFAAKFKTPKDIVKTPEEILFKTEFDVDLFEKLEPKFIQKKITDVGKGKFLVAPSETILLEKTPDLTGMKPFVKKPEMIKPITDLKKWKITEQEEKRFLQQKESAYQKLRETKVFRLKDIVKQPPVQKKLFEKDILIGTKPFIAEKPEMIKPITDLKKWEITESDEQRWIKQREAAYNKLSEWKTYTLKDIVKPKPIVKTKQTTLDLSGMPDARLVPYVKYVPPVSKPFQFKKIVEDKITKDVKIFSDKTVSVLKKIETKSTFREFDFEAYKTKPSAVSKETLRRLGRFGTDEYVRMTHPEAPKGVVKPADRLDLFAAPIIGRISKTEISQVKVTGEFSGRLMQIGKVNVFESAMSKLIDVQQRNELKMSQGILQSSLNIQDIVSGERQIQVQAQTQAQIQRQMLRTETILTSPTKMIFEEPSVTVTPPAILGFEAGLMGGVSLFPQAYHGYVYKTQFEDGRRIRGKIKERVTKHPRTRLDALAETSDIVDNTAKRTIILEPVDEKPVKLRKKLPSWTSRMFEYNQKSDNKYVEINKHAIDSPGELREITMKGIAARKRGGKRRKTGVLRDFSNIGVRMDREMNRIGRRMII